MPRVHVFASLRNFASEAELIEFVRPTYTKEGDEVPSSFGREVGISSFESGCIECMVSAKPQKIFELLSGASYGSSWIHGLHVEDEFCAAVCIYPPNVVATPARSSFKYLGAYEFDCID